MQVEMPIATFSNIIAMNQDFIRKEPKTVWQLSLSRT